MTKSKIIEKTLATARAMRVSEVFPIPSTREKGLAAESKKGAVTKPPVS